MRVALALVLLLAACAPPQPAGPGYYGQTHVGAHLNTRSGTVSPSVGTRLGPVSIAANGGGGAIGTRFGPIGLSAGF